MIEYEPYGMKSVVVMQPVKIVPISAEGKRNLPKHLRNRSKNQFVYLPMPSFRVNVKLIDTKEKLAWFIYSNYGYGEWNVMGWNIYKKNRKYNSRFLCVHPDCEFYKIGWTNREGKHIKCHHYLRFKNKPGLGCHANKKLHPNWDLRAGIIIKPSFVEGKEIEFKFIPHKNLMHRYFFWKG